MRKTYVLDTNVLIQAPYALGCFEDNDLVLPLAVLEELDSLKKAEGERGANARAAIRALEWHRCRGDLLEGVPLENGGTLRVESNCVDVTLPDSLSDSVQDNRILRVCKGLHRQGGQIVLVTKDILLRLKAQMLGLAAEDFTTEQAPENGMGYTGRIECYAPEARFRDFRKRGVPCEELYQTDEAGSIIRPSLMPNQFVVLHADQSNKRPSSAAYAGKRWSRWSIVSVRPTGSSRARRDSIFCRRRSCSMRRPRRLSSCAAWRERPRRSTRSQSGWKRCCARAKTSTGAS